MLGRHVIRRWWAIALFALLAGGITWMVVHGRTKTYERDLSMVVVPGKTLPDQQVSQAVWALDQPNSQLLGTIVATVTSDGFFQGVSRTALGTPVPPGYTISGGTRPASDVVEVHLRGRDPHALGMLATGLGSSATAWVDSTYRAYQMSVVSSTPSAGPVAPRTTQLTALAALMGAAIAASAAYAEGAIRQRRRPAGADESRTPRVVEHGAPPKLRDTA